MNVVQKVKHIILFVVVISFLTYSPLAYAKANVSKQEANHDRIENLLAQVKKLKQQLARLQMQEQAGATFSYKTKFYKGTYEALYQVDGGTLTPQKGQSVRNSDRLLWNTFVDIVGDDFIDDNISEFRIYNNSRSEVSAFVEEKPDDTWILGFNREGENIADIYDDESVVDLLIHEYGHIVFFSSKSIENDFKKAFWGKKQTADDFVTSYAATNATEDLAESFVYFVKHDKPTQTGERYDKVRFFYEYPKLINLRTQLRASDLF